MQEAIHNFADGDAKKGLAAFAERGLLCRLLIPEKGQFQA